jgi:hypothetical protein
VPRLLLLLLLVRLCKRRRRASGFQYCIEQGSLRVSSDDQGGRARTKEGPHLLNSNTHPKKEDASAFARRRRGDAKGRDAAAPAVSATALDARLAVACFEMMTMRRRGEEGDGSS